MSSFEVNNKKKRAQNCLPMHVVIRKMRSLKHAVIRYIGGDRGGVKRLVE
jgi:hypothetical protein